MDNKRKNGGLAFPVDLDDTRHPGMTFRDYLAAQAMQGILANYSDDAPSYNQNEIARRAYIIADAMIRERDK